VDSALFTPNTTLKEKLPFPHPQEKKGGPFTP